MGNARKAARRRDLGVLDDSKYEGESSQRAAGPIDNICLLLCIQAFTTNLFLSSEKSLCDEGYCF